MYVQGCELKYNMEFFTMTLFVIIVNWMARWMGVYGL